MCSDNLASNHRTSSHTAVAYPTPSVVVVVCLCVSVCGGGGGGGGMCTNGPGKAITLLTSASLVCGDDGHITLTYMVIILL